MLRLRRFVALTALAAGVIWPAGTALAMGAAGPVPTTPGYTIAAPVTSAPGSPSRAAGVAPGHAATHGGGGGISNAAIALAAAGALLVLGCAGWAIYRLGGFQARWTVSLRHSVDEAGYRLGETAAELRDWARLGR